jgi:hypothetical protein
MRDIFKKSGCHRAQSLQPVLLAALWHATFVEWWSEYSPCVFLAMCGYA